MQKRSVTEFVDLTLARFLRRCGVETTKAVTDFGFVAHIAPTWAMDIFRGTCNSCRGDTAYALRRAVRDEEFRYALLAVIYADASFAAPFLHTERN